jgi:hypothetical protein
MKPRGSPHYSAPGYAARKRLRRSGPPGCDDLRDADRAAPAVVVDRAVLEHLQADLGDDTGTIIAELIDLFLIDAPQQLAAIQTALAIDAADIVQRAAHTLKSTSASLGAQSLAA